MEALHWLHYLDSYEGVIVALGLLLTAYALHRDERARQVSNMLAIEALHIQLQEKLLTVPGLKRVLKSEADLDAQPVSDEESVFVKLRLLHLDTTRRAARAGMMVKIAGVKSDVKGYLSLPIPKAVWEKMKPFQDQDFVEFVEKCLTGE